MTENQCKRLQFGGDNLKEIQLHRMLHQKVGEKG